MGRSMEACSVAELKEKARWMRRRIIEMTTRAGSGHPSSSLSEVEIMTALFFGGVMHYDSSDPSWSERDRLVLSKGHGCPALYASLAEAGYFPFDWLDSLRQVGSPLEGHPNMRRCPGIECSTGSLGQGLSIACGQALAGKLDDIDYRVYTILGDGECNEGQVWEAAMTARQFGLDNLTAIIDHNKFQQTGNVFDIIDFRPFADKWRSFGWHAVEVDGHDVNEVLTRLRELRNFCEGPSVLIAHTVKGKGVSFVEADHTFHGKALTPAEQERALEELGFSEVED